MKRQVWVFVPRVAALWLVCLVGGGLASVAAATPAEGLAAARGPVAPLPGRVYDASGGSGLGVSYFQLDVSRGGGRVRLTATQLGLKCSGGQDRGSVLGISTDDGMASVRSDGSFRVVLTVISDSPGQVVHDSPVRISGRFTSAARAHGLLKFKGADGEDTGCNSSSRWTATVRPLNDHFVGATSTGVGVKFDRSVEAHPRVLNFSVDGVRSRCASGGSETKSVSGGFGGPVRHSRFSATAEDAGGEAAIIAGRFTSRTRARGTVGLAGRDDCGYNGLHWTAKLTGRGV